MSTTDILIAVYSDEEELGEVLHHSGGVIGYVCEEVLGRIFSSSLDKSN